MIPRIAMPARWRQGEGDEPNTKGAVQSGRRRVGKPKPPVPNSDGPDAIPPSHAPPRLTLAPMLPPPNCCIALAGAAAAASGLLAAACCCWRAAPLSPLACAGEGRIARPPNPIRPLASPDTPGAVVWPAWGRLPACSRVIGGPPRRGEGARRARVHLRSRPQREEEGAAFVAVGAHSPPAWTQNSKLQRRPVARPSSSFACCCSSPAFCGGWGCGLGGGRARRAAGAD